MTTGGGPADLDAITEAVRQAVASSQARAVGVVAVRVTCKCGCGQEIEDQNTGRGRKREYVNDQHKKRHWEYLQRLLGEGHE